MGYKLIAIDLDDTLLDDRLEISNENLKAIEYAHLKDVKIVISTGRSIKSIMKYVESIKTISENDYYIVFNGGVVSTVGGDIIFKKAIENPLYLELVEFGRQADIDVQVYSEENLIVENYSDIIKRYESVTDISAVVVSDLNEMTNSIKILYNCLDIDKLKELKKVLEEKYSDLLNIFFSKPTYLEVLVKDANKGLALKYLAEHLNIPSDEVIAIGDSQNDSYMIEYAGLGVCVKNGRESVKKIAKYITEKTNNEHAVAEVIYKFV